MPVPSFVDTGGWNIRDIDTNKLVAKVHVEEAAIDAAGGRTFVIHWGIAKSNTGDSGWGVWTKPTQNGNKSWRWEPTGESLQQFMDWMHLGTRKGALRYLVQGSREVDIIP